MKTQDLLLQLLNTSRKLVARQSDPAFDLYKPALANCDAVYQDCGNQWLAAATQLDNLVDCASAEANELLDLLRNSRDQLFWEQSYKASDNLVPQAMLEGYGFVEFVGKRGPFVSEQVRCGIGIWGPYIDYPTHRHKAREIYLVLAGGAEFTVGDQASFYASAEQAVTVTSMTNHGFRTLHEPLAVFYLWQGGDLRETSTFTP